MKTSSSIDRSSCRSSCRSSRWLLGAGAVLAALLSTSSAGWAQPAPAAPAAQPAPATETPPASPMPDNPAAMAPEGGAAAPAPASPMPDDPAAMAPGGADAAASPAPTPAPAPAAAAANPAAAAAAKPHDTSGTYWLPKAVNEATDGTDLMFYAVLGLSFFFFFAIAGAVVWFVWKYRHRPGHKAQPSASHNDALEITWTVIPSIICVFLFVYGWRGYVHGATPPRQAIEIQTLAYRWGWTFTHANGGTDSDLHVPANTPVRLVMTAKDVLHSFFVPVLRTKQDIIPRRYTYVWFNATKPGTYRLYCAEFCGRDHSQMKVKLVVHPTGGYEQYLESIGGTDKLPPVELGKILYEKRGCNACHSLDGSPKVGPSFKATYGTKVMLATGEEVDMDENYIRKALLAPNAQARPGFGPVMPSFEGQLKEHEITGLVEFIKSLK